MADSRKKLNFDAKYLKKSSVTPNQYFVFDQREDAEFKNALKPELEDFGTILQKKSAYISCYR